MVYKVGTQDGRIFYYNENWWSRGGDESQHTCGRPMGPDMKWCNFPMSNMILKFGPLCHPACDCGRYLEIGNWSWRHIAVHKMALKSSDKPNVDFGGGLERIAAAKIDSPDVFKISLLWPIIIGLEKLQANNMTATRLVCVLLPTTWRAAAFTANRWHYPQSNKGHVMRRLWRAIRYAFDLGIEQGLCGANSANHCWHVPWRLPWNSRNRDAIIATLVNRKSLRPSNFAQGYPGICSKLTQNSPAHETNRILSFYDTFGFPAELTLEEAEKQNKGAKSVRDEVRCVMAEQRARSQTAAKPCILKLD